MVDDEVNLARVYSEFAWHKWYGDAQRYVQRHPNVTIRCLDTLGSLGKSTHSSSEDVRRRALHREAVKTFDRASFGGLFKGLLGAESTDVSHLQPWLRGAVGALPPTTEAEEQQRPLRGDERSVDGQEGRHAASLAALEQLLEVQALPLHVQRVASHLQHLS